MIRKERILFYKTNTFKELGLIIVAEYSRIIVLISLFYRMNVFYENNSLKLISVRMSTAASIPDDANKARPLSMAAIFRRIRAEIAGYADFFPARRNDVKSRLKRPIRQALTALSARRWRRLERDEN